MARTKVSVNTSPVASGYEARNQKIIEYSDPDGCGVGGLILFAWHPDTGHLTVNLYRHDPAVNIIVSDPS